MSKIISIGTAVPAYKHAQRDILSFMQQVFALPAEENRKLRFLYSQSGIDTRYSVVPDYSRTLSEWKFYPHTENLEPFPSLEQRMLWFNRYAPMLSVDAIRNCLQGSSANEITHLITVSCTGMSAPGLDLMVMDLLSLPTNIYRTSVNFMGCYAAIHAMKIADSICNADEHAKVMIVCAELCTLHFQREPTQDVIAASLLFGDGAAAMLITHDKADRNGLRIEGFYSEVMTKGKRDMSWELGSNGFLMTLSGYIPELIEQDFQGLVKNAFDHCKVTQGSVDHWCIHPGGKRILASIQRSLNLDDQALNDCYDVLRRFGNMSSPTILFVLNEQFRKMKSGRVFGAAFGPGLTMETFVASAHA